MGPTITVGKNVAKILGHEFPIDNDLSLSRHKWDECSWQVNSAHEQHDFQAIKEGEVTAEAFRTYGQALNHSVAFNEKGKIRKMFERKEQGVKIVPGHGVFTLPAKMQVVGTGLRKVRIRVFGGTDMAKEFHYSSYEHMVDAAAEYYFENIRNMTNPINESLWYPVKYNTTQREFEGLELPLGIQVDDIGARFRVRYYSVSLGRVVHFGVAKDLRTLAMMLIEADDKRHSECMIEAMYRFVRPSYISLSQYMRGV